MRGIVYRGIFTHSGKYSYDATLFAGTVGVYTGTKKGAFSVSENQRYPEKNILGLL